MDSRPVIWVFGLVILGFVGGQVGVASTNCGFQAVYNFGDSNSDTGARSAALGGVPPPNGITFFGKPSGRACDGRLIIDFIAENLGLPYLSAYLDSIGTSFRHGANFAVSGSSIRPGGYSPIHLDLQIDQFSQFKSRTTALYNQVGSNDTKTYDGGCKMYRGGIGLKLLTWWNPGKSTTCTSSIPRPEDFPKALYSFDIGQNDLSFGFQNSPEEQVRASIPDIVDNFSKAVQKLYDEGARVFWVHNTGPLGCLPYSVINDQSKPGNLDANGCVKPFNEVAMEFNRQLKYRVSQLKAQLVQSTFTYVDVYSAKYSLISNAKSLGFEDPMQFCCGSYYGYHVNCGTLAYVNGTVYGHPCKEPSKRISWDGIHYTEAANKLVAELIVNGSLSDPPISIANACHTP